jgi:type II secretory pathway component PulJ
MLHLRRTRRAFTVLETVISLAISSLILLALVLWVSSLMRSTTSAIQMSSTNRSVRTVSTRLEADIMEISTCDLNGVSPALVRFTAAEIGFYADVVDPSGVPARDGVADYVLWSFDGSTLTRGVSPGTGSCPSMPPTPTAALVFEATVAPLGTTPVFTVYSGTTPLSPEENCLHLTATCPVDSLRLRATLDDVENSGAAPSTLDLSLSLAHAPARL